jgi:uncharacterized protein YqjF (DUF2071 family)
MLNYEIDPAVLIPYVPLGTEIDSFRGKTYVSMVAFLFQDTRVLGIPIPFHRNFEEINLRFYVSYDSQGELRRGVVFIREIVPRTMIAFVAKWLFEENYIALPTRHTVSYGPGQETNPTQVGYSWKFRGRWNSISVNPVGDAYELVDESEEAFITEHYWGYTKHKNGASSEYRVEHPRWNIWRVEAPQLDCDIATLYGPEFAPYVKGAPSSAFLADGSPVSVYSGHRLGPGG